MNFLLNFQWNCVNKFFFAWFEFQVFFSSAKGGSSCQIYFMTLNKPGMANWWSRMRPQMAQSSSQYRQSPSSPPYAKDHEEEEEQQRHQRVRRGVVRFSSKNPYSLPRTSFSAAKKCTHRNHNHQDRGNSRYYESHESNNNKFANSVFSSNNNENYHNNNNYKNTNNYEDNRQQRRYRDYSDEEHQYLASDDDEHNYYDYERLKRYRNRLSSRRISPGTINRVNLMVKRFLCFLACPSLRSSVRYSQDC